VIWADVPDRDHVREVMARREFQYPRSIMERIGDWIADKLDHLFNRLSVPGASGSAFGGGVGSLIGWLMILLALAAVVAVVVIVVRHWMPRSRDDGEALSATEVEHRRKAREWASEAERLEADGEWKLAVRARHRELVRTLVDRRLVADLAGRTTGELRGDIDETTPSAAEEFDTACLLFELPWYGHVATGEEENRRFKAAAAAVLAAPVLRQVGDHPVAAAGAVVVMGAEVDGVVAVGAPGGRSDEGVTP